MVGQVKLSGWSDVQLIDARTYEISLDDEIRENAGLILKAGARAS